MAPTTKSEHVNDLGTPLPEVSSHPAEQRQTYQPPEVEAARAVLAGELPPVHCIDYRPEFTPDSDPGVAQVYLAPEEAIAWYSDPSNGTCSHLVGEASWELENALEAKCPAALRAVYARATREALAVLSAVAAGEPYGNLRLSSRVCQAVRAELAQLVAEWESVGGASC